jgi:hypothetical protein
MAKPRVKLFNEVKYFPRRKRKWEFHDAEAEQRQICSQCYSIKVVGIGLTLALGFGLEVERPGNSRERQRVLD